MLATPLDTIDTAQRKPNVDGPCPAHPDSGTAAGHPPESAGRRAGTEETHYPTWLVMLLSFMMGATVTAGAMAPVVITPDRQRGVAEGLKLGRELRQRERDDVFAAGYQAGYSDHSYGFPKKR